MPYRILVVDDNEQNRYVMLRSLRNPDWIVEACATGVEALEKVKTVPDLVILDMRLPDIPGYEVCRSIKQDPRTRDIPVLQVSAYVGEQGKAAAHAAGADRVLVHPLDPRVLNDVVSSLLAGRPGTTANLNNQKS
ncbi:MAG TPA: response regulator [Candidatus Angelobacter sp.]|nr:response regulator [Candidatus Angelobacter sp.]